MALYVCRLMITCFYSADLKGGAVIDQIKYAFLWLVTPFQKALQRLGRQEALINSDQVELIKSLIQPGDIGLSFEKGRLTSWAVRGFYDHAVIVTDILTVMEAVGDKFIDGKNIGGVREVALDEWLYKKDSVCILRPIYKNTFIKTDPNQRAAMSAIKYHGKSYDYQFKKNNENVYCSELVYLCYLEHDPDFMQHIDGEILPIHYYEQCFDSTRDDMFIKMIIEVKN